MSNYDEATFESAIEIYLSEHDKYIKRDHTQFDRKLCIDTGIFCGFVRESQPKEWEYLEQIHKDKTSQILIDDLTRALDSDQEGCLNVLRHGFKCYGKMIKGAYFKPVTGMNPETQRLYGSNKLTIVRQVRYSESHNNSIDVVLTVNGIPVVTMELKNPMTMTGQNYSHARTQYMLDRDPGDKIFQFKKRSLVNFAVDTDEVYMTTRLNKKETFFLPFNKGRNHGKGNPDNPAGYKTSYLWEEVLQSDSLLEIISRFLHLQIEEKKKGNKKIKKETMIFPRYHQLDVVRRLMSTSRLEGPGNNYLIQHSAGSGKSNSIAWTAHRLASLHDENNKVFSSVIVVTDRRVLDQQLQNTIYQFEHKDGVVKKIDQNSSQLADSLTSGTPIIITTLQKFPFIIQKVGDLKERTYAVIVDEAHSSMGGQTASEMKGVLGEQVEEENYEYESSEEEIIREINKRGPQKNISFFAFTATPKYKTLEVFGREGIDGKPEPFHLYSMRQAIEEGFILDVLENYTTYKTYYKLIKSIKDDPTVDKKKASLALARFMSLHPHNISQKVEVIVEHFRTHTKHKMEGRAKAMVVTRSRLHAVRYKQAIDKYLKEHNYTDIGTLVAFSATVDDNGIPFTEVGMNNGIKEKVLPEKFGTDDFSILIVANKYQTGFDQPLLHSMYIDRTLGGIQAIQTLSRLNRINNINPRKTETFVLDFVNEPEEIQLAFQPYYERAVVGEQSEYGKLYELQNKLKGFNVYFEEEISEFCRFFFSSKKKLNPKDHSQMNSILDKGVSRFVELDDTEKEDFRSRLVSFRNLYSFLSQIILFSDTDLEKLYTYLKFLYTKLPRKDKSSILSLDDDVDLKYYRLQKISEGSIKLMVGEENPVSGSIDVGGGQKELELEELSTIIELVNDRFKTDFTKGDELFFDSVREDAMNDEGVRDSAKVNTLDGFSYVFNKKIEDLFVDRMEQNEVLTSKFLNDRDFKKVVSKYLMKQAYEKIREEVVV